MASMNVIEPICGHKRDASVRRRPERIAARTHERREVVTSLRLKLRCTPETVDVPAGERRRVKASQYASSGAEGKNSLDVRDQMLRIRLEHHKDEDGDEGVRS